VSLIVRWFDYTSVFSIALLFGLVALAAGFRFVEIGMTFLARGWWKLPNALLAVALLLTAPDQRAHGTDDDRRHEVDHPEEEGGRDHRRGALDPSDSGKETGDGQAAAVRFGVSPQVPHGSIIGARADGDEVGSLSDLGGDGDPNCRS
jgi:hypothetical protein